MVVRPASEAAAARPASEAAAVRRSRSCHGLCCRFERAYGRVFGRVRGGGLANPLPLFVRLHPMRDALLVARTAALEYPGELVPVDGAKPVMTGLPIEREFGVG